METKVKSVKGCHRLLDVRVTAEELSVEFDKVYADMSKVAHIPGFRKGKAPRDLIVCRYRKEAEEEVIKRAIPEYWSKVAQEENLHPVVMPQVEDVQFKDDMLYFSVSVDVRPEVKLQDYKKLKVAKKIINITDKMVEDTLEKLRHAQTEGAKDKHESAEEKPLPELNDAFAQRLGLNDMTALRDTLKKSLQEEAETNRKADMEQQIMEQLLRKASLDLPQPLVEKQAEEVFNRLKFNRILHGEKKEDVAAQEAQLKKEAQKAAQRQVSLSFILDEIARKENIEVNKEDIDGRIQAIAQQTQKTAEEISRYLEQKNLLSEIEAEIRNNKTMEFLLKEADVEEKEEK
ncbi:MAG: trigger factor [Candidatus Omnitrophota bacterium]